MKRKFRPMAAGVLALTVTGGMLAATVGTAAASFPGAPWQPAPSTEQIGTLAFYNSAGTQVTSGTGISHLFDYALASSAGPTDPNGIANLEFANPTPGQDPGLWPASADESSNYPNTAAPAPLNAATNPLVTLDSSGANLAAFKGSVPANTAAGYAGVYEVRAYTTDAGSYWAADIQVTGTGPTATWSEVYGTPAAAATTSTVVTTSGTPSIQGHSVTFTATETASDSSHPAGSVQFAIDGTDTGSGVAVSGSGAATLTTSALATGSHVIKATFTPSDTADFTGSNNTVTQVVQAPATPTTTTLAVAGGYATAGSTDVTFGGTVSPAAAAGTVEFFDNGSTTPLAVTGGPSVPVTAGSYNASFPTGFTATTHSLVAVFTPTDTTTYNGSPSAAFLFVTNAAAGTSCASETNPTSGCTDTQTIEGNIPPGTLSISTPYTDTNALNVGTLKLSADGTYWTTSLDATQPVFKCITVTDATSGGSPFTASALANPLGLVAGTTVGTFPASSYTSINGENVGLTNLAPSTGSCPDGTTPVNTYTKTVTATNNTAALGVVPSDVGNTGLGDTRTDAGHPAPHTVLTGTSGGDGTATYDGTLTLNAPTSTRNGEYKGTIVFTVSD